MNPDKRQVRDNIIKNKQRTHLQKLLGREPKENEIVNAPTDVGLMVPILMERIDELEDRLEAKFGEF